MLRWMIQITCMLGDVMLLTACIVALFVLIWWLSIPLIFITYRVWKSQGGLIAWTERKQFMENARKLGL